VAAYLAAQPPAQRRILKKIRSDIRAAMKGAEDAISYGIPVAKVGGKNAVWYAGFAKHVSMFPMGPAVLRLAKVDASKYVTSKGTIQFPIEKPPSSALVKRLVKARLAIMSWE
jgi:uncharacterized protein YdhG (YjbR/CyaY superfamily)